jgi:hypothetical protein
MEEDTEEDKEYPLWGRILIAATVMVVIQVFSCAS